jgi:hypothetical protein
MVAFTYKKMESEGDDPKYHIVGKSFSDTLLVGQLAHIRRVTEPDMKRSATAMVAVQRVVSDEADDAINITNQSNQKGWRTLNGISINDVGDNDTDGNSDKHSTNGGRKIKRKGKKTRRKKRKGGRKKTRKKRKRRKTRRKQKKIKRKTCKRSTRKH